jgi:hypothetical protein
VKYTRSRSSFCACWNTGSLAAVFQSAVKVGSRPVCDELPSTFFNAGRYFASTLPGLRCVYRVTSSSMSPVPEQKPMIPAVYPRPSWMSWMYLYCAFQFSEEFSALETSSIAISFFPGSSRFLCAPAGDGAAGCVADGLGFRLGEPLGLSSGSGPLSSLSSDAETPGLSCGCAAPALRK